MKCVNVIPICIGWSQYFTIYHSNSSTHPPSTHQKKEKSSPTPASLTNPRWRLHRPRLSARRWPWTRKPGSPAGLEFLRANFDWQRGCQDRVDLPICHVPGMHGEEAANTTWHLCLHPCLFQTKICLTFQVEMGWGWRDSISTIAVRYTVYRLSSKCIKTDMIHWYIYTYTYVCVCDMISFCNHCFNSGHKSIAPSFSTYVFQGIGPQHPQTSPNLPPVSRERNSTIRSSGANATPGIKSKHSLKAAWWLGK